MPTITDQSLPQSDIMIVDDNPANLKLLEDMLRQQGHEVRSFPLGRLALAAAMMDPPDLILLDVNMPEMNGYEVCERLKSTAELSDTPVIFLSALNQTQDKLKAFRSGAADYISKPFEFEEVHARVGTHLKLHDCQRSLKLHNQRLEETVAARTSDLHQLNAELEQRVVERTAQLEAANQELEAFSYSVSHDLRAPLRAVDGFSQAVLEDYGSQLPAEGHGYLLTIREGAQRMGALIDDLLTFSRLSRLPLHKQPVDIGKLVRDTLGDLSLQHEGRKIVLQIGDLPWCWGDPALLKQVWINLLSNALKYTQKREAAVVEIGCEPTPEGNVYFVRDNGVGFDMRYAHKLFGVFQRLHRAEDYEGTGVGLAIVQRVIHRHGGSISAEAIVDRGATFHFTLAEQTKP